MARTFIEKSLGQSLLGEKVIRYGEKRKGEKKTTNLVATNVCHTACLQRRTGSARTSLEPIVNTQIFTTLGQPFLGEK